VCGCRAGDRSDDHGGATAVVAIGLHHQSRPALAFGLALRDERERDQYRVATAWPENALPERWGGW
jgi:hypothetical protein